LACELILPKEHRSIVSFWRRLRPTLVSDDPITKRLTFKPARPRRVASASRTLNVNPYAQFVIPFPSQLKLRAPRRAADSGVVENRRLNQSAP